MSAPGQQLDPASNTAMWSAISAIVAVVAVQVAKAFIVWFKARDASQGKRAELSSRATLSDREQFNTLVGDMRVEYKSNIEDLKRELRETDSRLAETNKSMDVLRREDAQLRVDIAEAKRDLVYATEIHDRDRAEWTSERAHLIAEIDTLKLQVAQLQEQSRGRRVARSE